MKVVNFGSLNLDHVYAVDHIVAAGETEDTGALNQYCGGKGLNQSISLASAGANVFHAGQVGEEGGDVLVGALKERGVNTDMVRKVPGPSGHTIIQIDKNGQNSILLFGGSNRSITSEYVDEVLEQCLPGDILVLQNEINRLDEIIEKAYAKKIFIVLNPSPYDEKLATCDFGKISLFLVNEVEGFQMTGVKQPEEILKKFDTEYPNAGVVLTMGGDGSVYHKGDITVHQDIYRVPVVDTTAAGDTFTGYFIASLLESRPEGAHLLDSGDKTFDEQRIKKALARASRASSIAVSRAGASTSIPRRKEVDEAGI